MMENTFGISSTPKEPNNFIGSQTLADHYQELMDYAERKLGRTDTAGDLLHDVWESIVKNEQDGEGYRPDGSRFIENYGVMDWIKARICLYAKNAKYKGVTAHEVTVGMDDEEDETGTVDAVKRAYFNAGTMDDVDSIELAASVAEELEYLVSLDGINGVQFSYIVTHIQDLATMDVDKSVFDAIRAVGTDALECLKDVLQFSSHNPEAFQRVLAQSSVA